MDRMKAVVLAAGKGTRLQSEGSELPKVMRLANGKPLLEYVLDALSFLSREDTILVVGYKKEDVLARFGAYPFAVQAQQLGTGHAVLSAEDKLRGFDGSVLVCYGDMPLLTRETYQALINCHMAERNDCTILSSNSNENLPYGRMIRDQNGDFVEIVEDRDCSEAQRSILELNTGLYVFEAEKLLPALLKLKNNNTQEEYYLTDVPAILRGDGGKVGICMRELGKEIIGVNTAEQLAQAEEFLRARQADGQRRS